MSLLFLASENDAASKAYHAYARLFDVIFSEGTSPYIEDRLEATTSRVLTFNYDRLFERTFLKWSATQPTKLQEHEKDWKRTLQSILDGHDPSPDANRFALLKLHGSVAQHHFDGSNYQSDFHYKPDLQGKIDLGQCFFGEGEKWTPMMIFPHEKESDEQRLKERTYPFFRYQKAIWEHAQSLCCRAAEIHVLGYSMQSIDWFFFKKLIPASTVDGSLLRKVTISDHPSQKLRLVRLMEALRTELDGKWGIEFRAEKFFAQEW